MKCPNCHAWGSKIYTQAKLIEGKIYKCPNCGCLMNKKERKNAKRHIRSDQDTEQHKEP